METSTGQHILSAPSYHHTDVEPLLNEFSEYRHPAVSVLPSISVPGQKALRAQENIPANTVVFIYTNTVSRVRTRTSIQVCKGMHIEAGEFGSYTNHSCNPNAAIRAMVRYPEATVCLVTIKNTKAGEELTFDYATTEDNLTPDLQIVSCLCGHSVCRGKVKYFGQLCDDEKQNLVDRGLVLQYLAGK